MTAKLDGQAQINVSLSIDASPELLALMRGNVSTTAYGDLRPDIGVSMPESSPIWRARFHGLAAVLAVSWDTQLSRGLTTAQAVKDPRSGFYAGARQDRPRSGGNHFAEI